MVTALSRAAGGIRDAFVRLDVAAHDIVRASTPDAPPAVAAAPAGRAPTLPPDRPPSSGSDLAAAMVELTVARVAFAANAESLRTAAALERTLVDLVA